jgi:hypothetical protein
LPDERLFGEELYLEACRNGRQRIAVRAGVGLAECGGGKEEDKSQRRKEPSIHGGKSSF